MLHWSGNRLMNKYIKEPQLRVLQLLQLLLEVPQLLLLLQEPGLQRHGCSRVQNMHLKLMELSKDEYTWVYFHLHMGLSGLHEVCSLHGCVCVCSCLSHVECQIPPVFGLEIQLLVLLNDEGQMPTIWCSRRHTRAWWRCFTSQRCCHLWWSQHRRLHWETGRSVISLDKPYHVMSRQIILLYHVFKFELFSYIYSSSFICYTQQCLWQCLWCTQGHHSLSSPLFRKEAAKKTPTLANDVKVDITTYENIYIYINILQHSFHVHMMSKCLSGQIQLQSSKWPQTIEQKKHQLDLQRFAEWSPSHLGCPLLAELLIEGSSSSLRLSPVFDHGCFSSLRL